LDQYDAAIYTSACEVHTLGVELVAGGRMSIEEFIDRYGIVGIYEWTRDLNFASLSTSLCDRLMAWVAFSIHFGNPSGQRGPLVSIGELLPKRPTPWLDFAEMNGNPGLSVGGMRIEAGDSDAELDSRALFGFFCMVAPLVEIDPPRWRRELRLWIAHSKQPLARVAHLLGQRPQAADLDAASDVAVQLGFDVDQRRFALEWVAGTTNLVETQEAEATDG